MNTNHHIGSDGHQYLMLDLPEDARHFTCHKDQLVYMVGNAFDERTNESKWAFLPTGNWQILGRENELTEEQRLGIVQSNECSKEDKKECFSSYCRENGCSGTGQFYYYTNPMSFDGDPAYTSEESVSSLTTSVGLDNPLIIKNLDK